MPIVGIYSFPKSGNTWMRYALGAAFGVRPFDVAKRLPAVHENPILETPLVHDGREYHFYKSHQAEELKRFDGKDIHNDHIIYIIRHPLDVFVSFANHLSDNVGAQAISSGMVVSYESVDAVAGTPLFDMLFHTFCLYGTLQPRSKGFGSWFSNAEYFLGRAADDERIIVLRYEDLLTNFEPTMRTVLEKIGNTSASLKHVFEQAEGATSRNGSFFWKKKKNNYLEYLTPRQIEIFRDFHGARAAALGYRI